MRKCPVCGFVIKDDKTFRCPRCNASLLSCFGCTGNCKTCGLVKKS